MEDHIPLSGPIDLNALDGYLMSDHAPDDSMGLSDLDGFLTGIAYSARSWAATELALGRHNYPYKDICGCLLTVVNRLPYYNGGTAMFIMIC